MNSLCRLIVNLMSIVVLILAMAVAAQPAPHRGSADGGSANGGPADGGPANGGPADGRLREIGEAWRERQDTVRQLHMAWCVDRSGKHRWSTYQTAWSGSGSEDAAADTSQVWIRADVLRYETKRWYFDSLREFGGYNAPDRPRYQVPLNPRFDQNTKTSFERALSVSLDISPFHYSVPRGYVAVLTPDTCTEIFDAVDGAPVREATIRTADAWLVDEGWMLQPVLQHYRPFRGARGGIELQNCRVSGEGVPVNGRLCLLFEERRSASERNRYWIDPSRGYSVVRWIRERDSGPLIQVDTEFRSESDSTWHPVSWTIMLLAGSDVIGDYPGRQNVEQYGAFRVKNRALDSVPAQGTIDVSLAPGTIVMEKSTGRRYRVAEDGGRENLSDAELRRMGLAAAAGQRRSAVFGWILPGMIVGALLAGGLFRKRYFSGARP